MIANYPIRIGVLEQAFLPPPSIDPGTGIFIRIGLLGSHYNNAGLYTLPLQSSNPTGLISWGDGSAVQAVPASSTGLQHTYPSDTWSGEIQTQWLTPNYGIIELDTGVSSIEWNPSLGRSQWKATEWWNSVPQVSSIKVSGTYLGTNPIMDRMAQSMWSISGFLYDEGKTYLPIDVSTITGVTSMNQTFKGMPSGAAFLYYI